MTRKKATPLTCAPFRAFAEEMLTDVEWADGDAPGRPHAMAMTPAEVVTAMRQVADEIEAENGLVKAAE